MTTDTTHTKSQDITGPVLVKYWPIIVAGAATLISLGGIYVKLDYIAKALDRTDTQFSAINERQNMAGQSIVEIRGQITQLTGDNARNAQAIAETRNRVEVLIDKARWAPGVK